MRDQREHSMKMPRQLNQMDNEKRSIRGKALNDSEDTDKADTRLQFSEIPADSWITFGISAIALAAIIFVIKHRK